MCINMDIFPLPHFNPLKHFMLIWIVRYFCSVSSWLCMCSFRAPGKLKGSKVDHEAWTFIYYCEENVLQSVFHTLKQLGVTCRLSCQTLHLPVCLFSFFYLPQRHCCGSEVLEIHSVSSISYGIADNDRNKMCALITVSVVQEIFRGAGLR